MPKEQDLDAEDKEKSRLEAIFLIDIRSLFNRMNNDNMQSIFSTGVQIDAGKYQGEWEAILRKHYLRTQKSFNGDIEKTLTEAEQGLSDAEKALIAGALIKWRDNASKDVAKLITDTNNKKIEEALVESRILLTNQSQDIDNINLATTSAVLLARKNKSRSQTIAESETQNAAESTKLIESTTLSGDNPDNIFKPLVFTIGLSTKTWNTRQDSLVRPAHREAQGQQKNLNDPFTVGGELLRTPRDSSLGASAKNTINCRCSATYNIVRIRQ